MLITKVARHGHKLFRVESGYLKLGWKRSSAPQAFIDLSCVEGTNGRLN